MTILVAPYCRVSTKHDDQINSLQAQLHYYLGYANDKENTEIYKVYYDTGLSATSWKKRKYFREMLYDAGLDFEVTNKGNITIELSDRVPLFSRILVKDVSRFTRNLDMYRIITLLREKKVYIDFTNMNISTENLTDDMMLQMFIVFAQRESQDRSEKVLWGLKRSAEEGRIRVRDNFFGYKYIKETRELQIIEDEAEVIRKIFALYNEGLGFRKILNWLEDNKVTNRQGKLFGSTTLQRMVSNPAFKGWLIRNKMDSPLVFSSKKSATLKDESEWEIHRGVIPAIVTEEVFDLAQSTRESKVNQERKGVKVFKGKYAGKIRCNKCEQTYTQNREAVTGKVFFNCKTKKNRGKSVCDAPNITLQCIDEALNRFSNDGLSNTVFDFAEGYSLELNEFKNELSKRIDNQQIDRAEEIKIKMKEVNEQRKRLIKLYARGKHDEDTLNELTQELDTEYSQLENDYFGSTASNEKIKQEIQEIENVIVQLKEFKISKKLSEDELLALISSIRVTRTDETICAKTGEHSQEKSLILHFEFKVFEKLNEIAESYKGLKKIHTNNGASVIFTL